MTVAALGGGGFYYYAALADKPLQQESQATTSVKLTRGEIRSAVSGTSQLAAKSMQNITAPSDGTISVMNLSPSQEVKEGEVLLQITNPTMEANLKDAETSLLKLQKELSSLQKQKQSLQIYAPASGKFSVNGNLESGSNISESGKIGTISDISRLKATLPFLVEEAVQLKAGSEIDLQAEGLLLSKVGKVESIGRVLKAGAGGTKLVDVTVSTEGGGSIDAGVMVSGSVSVDGVKIEAQSTAGLEFDKTTAVLSGASGTISQLLVKDGEYIEAGEPIAVISNDSLDDNILSKEVEMERQQANVDNLRKQIEELTIKAPFDGVFSSDFAEVRDILATYTQGSAIKSGTTLGAVASLDMMNLTVQADELDLPSMKPGLKAEVTVDALSGRIFEGEVTQVSSVGATTNGVTYYDVIIAVPNTNQKDLKYGMTATAEILVEQKQDVIMLPVEALQARRGQYSVTLKKADGTLEASHPITIGIRNQTHVEVVDGLQEGDEVVIPLRQQSEDLNPQDAQRMREQFMQQMQNGGGFQGGGAFPNGEVRIFNGEAGGAPPSGARGGAQTGPGGGAR